MFTRRITRVICSFFTIIFLSGLSFNLSADESKQSDQAILRGSKTQFSTMHSEYWVIDTIDGIKAKKTSLRNTQKLALPVNPGSRTIKILGRSYIPSPGKLVDLSTSGEITFDAAAGVEYVVKGTFGSGPAHIWIEDSSGARVTPDLVANVYQLNRIWCAGAGC